MSNTIQIAIDILLALLTGGILLFFLEILHLEGSVSREFKEVMNPFYHKLSKYLVVVNHYSLSLIANRDDAQITKFKNQVETLSKKGMESVMTGRDISYLSAKDLDTLCEEVNNIWYVLDRDGQLMLNLKLDDGISKDEALEAINESFPAYKDKPLDIALLSDLSGRFYYKIWEPIQHCTHNYEFFQSEERKSRKILICGLGLTLLSLIVIMIWANSLPVFIPCLLVIVSSILLATGLKQLYHVSYISKRLIRSTRDEINENHKSVSDMCKKFVRWFEPIGLILLLVAFGWQCLDEHSQQIKMESYLYETNEKLVAIWEGVYDEALHSERYNGNTTVSVNYDVLDKNFKYWNEVKNGMSTLDKQSDFFSLIRVVLYVLGSILIIVAKLPKKIEQRQ